MNSLRSIADALGGDVISNRYVLCPGPGHSRKDRSLKVRFKQDGSFSVTSFTGDDWKLCKDFIRDKLGLPSDWKRELSNDNSPTVILCDRDDEPARIRSALRRWETAFPFQVLWPSATSPAAA